MDWSKEERSGMNLTEGTGWWIIENLLPLWKEYVASVEKENRERDEWGRKQNKALLDEHTDKIKQAHDEADARYEQELSEYKALMSDPKTPRSIKRVAKAPWKHSPFPLGYPASPNLWGWKTTPVNMDGFLSWLADREVP